MRRTILRIYCCNKKQQTHKKRISSHNNSVLNALFRKLPPIKVEQILFSLENKVKIVYATNRFNGSRNGSPHTQLSGSIYLNTGNKRPINGSGANFDAPAINGRNADIHRTGS